MTALAVDNALLFERQADHAQRLSSLLEAGRTLTSSLDLQDVLAALVQTAAASLGCPEALIFEYDADADTLTMRSVYQERPTVYEDLDKPYSLDDYPSDRDVLESSDVDHRDASPTRRCPPTCATPCSATARRPASPSRCGTRAGRWGCSPW